MNTGVAHTVAQLVDGSIGDNGRQRFIRAHSVDRAVGARTGRVHSTPVAATAATLRGQDTFQANFTDGRRFHFANCNFSIQKTKDNERPVFTIALRLEIETVTTILITISSVFERIESSFPGAVVVMEAAGRREVVASGR